MITKIQEAHKELTETLKKFQEKYEATHLDLVQVVQYSLDTLSSPAPVTETLTPKGEAELKAKKDKEAKADAKTEKKHSTSPATDLR